jgi:hypothetical protein
VRTYFPEHTTKDLAGPENTYTKDTHEGMAGIDAEMIDKNEDAIFSIFCWFAVVSCPPFLLGSSSNEHPGGMDVIALIKGTTRLLT